MQSTLCDSIRGGQTLGSFTCALTDDMAYEGRPLRLSDRRAGRAGRRQTGVRASASGGRGGVRCPGVRHERGRRHRGGPDVLVRATVKEAMGMELGLVLLLRGGRRCSCGARRAAAARKSTRAGSSTPRRCRLRRADIAGINLRVLHSRSSSSPSASVSYLGQLYLNTVVAHRSLQSRVSSAPSLPALIHWPIRYASSPQLVTLYVAWLPALGLSDGDVVHYELQVDGRYVGCTRRCLFVLEDMREDRLQGASAHRQLPVAEMGKGAAQ